MTEPPRPPPRAGGIGRPRDGGRALQKGMGSYEVLLKEADRALYQAKSGGRDLVCVAAQRRTEHQRSLMR